jgi:hypothetical protein
MSPYWARETIGGTRATPRTLVGGGDAVGEGDALADGAIVGVGPELAGATHAPAVTNVVIRRAVSFIHRKCSRTEAREASELAGWM